MHITLRIRGFFGLSIFFDGKLVIHPLSFSDEFSGYVIIGGRVLSFLSLCSILHSSTDNCNARTPE
jgi:hypothetical protein